MIRWKTWGCDTCEEGSRGPLVYVEKEVVSGKLNIFCLVNVGSREPFKYATHDAGFIKLTAHDPSHVGSRDTRGYDGKMTECDTSNMGSREPR